MGLMIGFEGKGGGLSIDHDWLHRGVEKGQKNYYVICAIPGPGDGHHDGGMVGRGGQFPLSANALSGQWVGVVE